MDLGRIWILQPGRNLVTIFKDRKGGLEKSKNWLLYTNNKFDKMKERVDHRAAYNTVFRYLAYFRLGATEQIIIHSYSVRSYGEMGWYARLPAAHL